MSKRRKRPKRKPTQNRINWAQLVAGGLVDLIIGVLIALLNILLNKMFD